MKHFIVPLSPSPTALSDTQSAQGLLHPVILLGGLRGPYVPMIKPELATCKANALPATVLLLQHQCSWIFNQSNPDEKSEQTYNITDFGVQFQGAHK